MIEFQGVSKVFAGHPAVKDLNLELREGAFSVLVGTSGSGKSTTLKMINRLLEPDRGTIRFAGEDIRQQPVLTLRRRMGYAIQSIGLFPHWTVAQNIATVPQLQNGRGQDRRPGRRADGAAGAGGDAARPLPASALRRPAAAWGWRGRWRQIRRCC
jgi:osmoprotectant transport system ATP-binding protein